MRWIKVRGETYRFDQLVKFIEHVGQREVGLDGAALAPEPVFGDYRYLELVFLDGSRVELDGVQSEAFRRRFVAAETMLDLDRVDDEALGPVFVHDAQQGDVILPAEPRDEGPADGIVAVTEEWD